MESPAPSLRRSLQALSAALATLLVCFAVPARAETPDASTGYHVEPGRTGFLGGGTLGRPPLTVRWRRTLGDQVGTPVVVGDRIYATFATPGDAGRWTVAALDARTGATRWTRSYVGPAKVSYGEGRVIVLTRTGIVTALREGDGATEWARQLSEPFDFFTSAVVSDGIVYVGLSWGGGSTHALRIADGTTAFHADFFDAGPPAVRGGLLFQSTGCETVAVDAKTGAPAWRASQGCTSYDGDVATAGGHVVGRAPSMGETAFVLDGATGKRIRSVPAHSAPAIAGDVLLVVEMGVLRARSLTTGAELWSAPGPFLTAPLVVDHAVYVEDGRGAIFAVDLRSGLELWRDQIRPPADYGYYEYPDWSTGIAAGAGALAVPAGSELVVYESALPALGAGLRITAGPEGPRRERSATFSIASPLPTQCRIDGGAWTPCAGTMSYALLAEGSHAFEVRNLASDVPQALVHRGFSIDATAPITDVTAGPEALTRVRWAQLRFITEGALGSECRLDEGEWKPCASPVEYAELADGAHAFQVRSSDYVGNVGEADRHDWTVDATAPVVTITSGPDRQENDRDVRVHFTQSEPGETRCSLDYRPPAPCTSPVAYDDLPDGVHWINVSVTDAAGNPGGAQVFFELDTVPPETYVHPTDPPAATSQPRPAFRFSSQFDTQPFECSLDGGDWLACQSGWHPDADLPDGEHTFRVRALDQAGNVDPTPATRTFTVDTRSPGLVIDSAPPERTSQRDASVHFHSDEPVEATCSWDGAPAGACGSPTSRGNLPDGPHSVKITVRDPAGNTADRTVAWTVDGQPPQTSVDGAPPHASAEQRPTFTFSSSEPQGASFQCRMDLGAWSACASPWQSAALADGPHEFQVRATDGVGNVDPSPATHAFVVDTRAPVVEITSAPPARTRSRSATVTWGTDEHTTARCAWDGQPFEPCTSPAQRDDLGDGPHDMVVRVRDTAGNEHTATAAWQVDTAAPETAIDSGPPASTKERRVTFAFSSGEAGARFECSLDGSAWFACTSPWTSADLAAGTHHFAVRALDDLDNPDGTPAAHTFTVAADSPPSTQDPSPQQPPSTQPPSTTRPPTGQQPPPAQSPPLPAPPARHWLIDPGARGWPGSAASAAEVLAAWLRTQKGATLARRRRFALPYLETRGGLLTVTVRSGGRAVARGRTTVFGPLTWARLTVPASQRARLRRARRVTVEVAFQPATGGLADRARRAATLRR